MLFALAKQQIKQCKLRT